MTRLGVMAALLSAVLFAATQAGAAAAAEPIASEQNARWETDEPVRGAMKAVRDLVLRDHSLVTHRRMPPAGARAFHGVIKTVVERMLAETKAAPGARAALEPIAREIVAGAEAVAGMKKDVEPIDGIVAIDEALADYARRFDHPGWQPLR
jgi:hypothetical protein